MTSRDTAADPRRVQDGLAEAHNQACGATRIEKPFEEHRDHAVAAPRQADAPRAPSRKTSAPTHAADEGVAVRAVDADAGPSRKSGRKRL